MKIPQPRIKRISGGMLRLAIGTILLLLGSVSAGQEDQRVDLYSILDGLMQPVDTITMDSTGRQSQFQGAAFVLGKLLVTSSQHLASDARSISYLRGEPLWQGTRVPGLDLTVLALPVRLCDQLCQVVPIGVGPVPDVGQPVVYLNKTLGQSRLVFGYISAADDKRHPGDSSNSCSRDHWVQLNAPLPAASLGAAILNAEDGNLVGIGVGNRQTSDGNVGLMAPLGCLMGITEEQDQFAFAAD